MSSPCTPPSASESVFCALDALTQAPPQRALLNQILNRPELRAAQSPNVNDWLAEWFRKLFPGWLDFFESKGAQQFASGTRVAVFVLALVVVLGMLWRMGRMRWYRAEKTLARANVRTTLPRAGTAEDPLSVATRWIDTDPRRALREALLGLLRFLETSGWFRRDPSKTNREISRELRQSTAPPSLVDACGSLLLEYDDRYYSLQAVNTEDAQRFLKGVHALIDLQTGNRS